MNLVVDANILVRCVVGRRAAEHAAAAASRGITLISTMAQLDEAVDVLVRVFGLEESTAAGQLLEVSRIMRVVEPADYQFAEQQARVRLHQKAQPDWPALAAALAMDGEIWTDDRDFFGVGVPIWSTPNLQFAKAAA